MKAILKETTKCMWCSEEIEVGYYLCQKCYDQYLEEISYTEDKEQNPSAEEWIASIEKSHLINNFIN